MAGMGVSGWTHPATGEGPPPCGHEAVKQGQSRGSVGTTCQGNGRTPLRRTPRCRTGEGGHKVMADREPVIFGSKVEGRWGNRRGTESADSHSQPGDSASSWGGGIGGSKKWMDSCVLSLKPFPPKGGGGAHPFSRLQGPLPTASQTKVIRVGNNATIGKLRSAHFWHTNFWVPDPLPPLASSLVTCCSQDGPDQQYYSARCSRLQHRPNKPLHIPASARIPRLMYIRPLFCQKHMFCTPVQDCLYLFELYMD